MLKVYGLLVALAYLHGIRIYLVKSMSLMLHLHIRTLDLRVLVNISTVMKIALIPITMAIFLKSRLMLMVPGR